MTLGVGRQGWGGRLKRCLVWLEWGCWAPAGYGAMPQASFKHQSGRWGGLMRLVRLKSTLPPAAAPALWLRGFELSDPETRECRSSTSILLLREESPLCEDEA